MSVCPSVYCGSMVVQQAAHTVTEQLYLPPLPRNRLLVEHPTDKLRVCVCVCVSRYSVAPLP